MIEAMQPMPTYIDQQQPTQELVEKARAERSTCFGRRALLSGLTKPVREAAPEDRDQRSIGYEKHDSAGRNRGQLGQPHPTTTVLTVVWPC